MQNKKFEFYFADKPNLVVLCFYPFEKIATCNFIMGVNKLPKTTVVFAICFEQHRIVPLPTVMFLLPQKTATAVEEKVMTDVASPSSLASVLPLSPYYG